MISTTSMEKDTYSDCHTAIEIYEFLFRMPPILGQFIFRQAAIEACNLASVKSFKDTRKELIEAFCYNFQENADPSAVYKLLNILEDNTVGLNNELWDSPAQLAKELETRCHLLDMPSADKFIPLYSCFSPDWQELDAEILESIRIVVNNWLINVSSDVNLKNDYTHNTFEAIGFKTFFMIFSANPTYDEKRSDCKFYQWYCKGEVLRIVIETVLNCGVTSISFDLWDYISKECEKKTYLRKAFIDNCKPFKNVYSLELTGDAPEQEPTSNDDSREKFPCLGELYYYSNKDETAKEANEEQLKQLYNLLKNCKYIEEKTPLLAFCNIFQKYTSLCEPIKWIGNGVELGAFLDVIFEEIIPKEKQERNSTKKDYQEKALKVFTMNKTIGSLKKAEKKHKDDFRDMFRNIGLYKEKESNGYFKNNKK